MHEIVFDTETTGFDPKEGHKLIEIGCIEVVNQIPTGRTYHQYINPERDVPQEAVAVHGLTQEFLKDSPVFGEIVGDFLDFIGTESKLVAHNAEFDMNFVNHEIKAFGFPSIDRRRVVDTLMIAREMFPGAPASLDALCRRFEIDNSHRQLHGALLDAEILAEVYLELMGGRQHGLSLADERFSNDGANVTLMKNRKTREPRKFDVSQEERAAHQAFLDELTDPIWKKSH